MPVTESKPSFLSHPGQAAADLAARGAQALRQIGPVRLAATALFVALGFLLAINSWSMPQFGAAERALYDLRVVAMAQVIEQDPRIVMVVFNDDTLQKTKRRSPLDRALLARALTEIDSLGPKAIGIDILVDEPQAEDPALVAALRGMKTPTFLGFTSSATNPFEMRDWQEAYERAFQAQLKGSHSGPASIRVEKEDDVVRRWPIAPPGEPPLLALSMAPNHPAFAHYQGSLRFRRPKFTGAPLYQEFPIDLFGVPLNFLTEPLFKKAIAGNYVLVGGDIADSDRVGDAATNLNHFKPPGLKVHADMLAQVLDNSPETPISPMIIGLITLVVIAAGVLTGWARLTPFMTAVAWVLEVLAIGGGPMALQGLGYDTWALPVFGWVVGWLIAYIATSAAARAVGSEQRNYAQDALGKYLPKDVAQQILRDPSQMTTRGERREICAVFTDLQGFTELTTRLEPEALASLLNTYLVLQSQAVLEHGGTIDKFVGDSVVAFWGAPIARADDAERATRAAISMWRVGEAFRKTPLGDVPALGRTRVGVHRGAAIVGNFGGEARFSYTALGDVMNTASRLEAANKQLETRVLVSREALPVSMESDFRAMGRIRLRGRATPVEVFEAAQDFPSDARQRLNAAYRRFDTGDVSALEEISAIADEFPDDPALPNLVRRLKAAGPGGVYTLN